MSATLTREGAIPHLLVDTPFGTILAPVKLQAEPDGRIRTSNVGSELSRRPAPMRRDGRLVFALPGGLEVLG